KRAAPVGPVEALPILADMCEWFVETAIERESIRKLKESGAPPPWTDNQIMRVLYLCNPHREDDRNTRRMNANIVQPCADDPELVLKIAIARFINEIGALGEIDWRAPLNLAAIRAVLEARQARGERVFRTQAYKYPMPPEIKGMSALACLFEIVLAEMWHKREYLQPRAGDTLRALHGRLCE